jgi:hypothetical protein
MIEAYFVLHDLIKSYVGLDSQEEKLKLLPRSYHLALGRMDCWWNWG